jgi:hypothetical protein
MFVDEYEFVVNTHTNIYTYMYIYIHTYGEWLCWCADRNLFLSFDVLLIDMLS